MNQHRCPNCQTLHQTDDLTQFVACTQCFAYLKIEKGALQTIPAFIHKQRPTDVCFEVGQMLYINGGEYTITGMTQRNDADYKNINWREYVLKTVTNEDAFLNEYNGNWLLVKPLVDFSAHPNAHTVDRDNKPYQLFQRYFQQVNWASGYFDYDITDIKKLYSKEYISPPKMLISESQKTDIETNVEWYEGEYVPHDEVYQQYQKLENTALWPNKIGVGPTEPHQSKMHFEEVMKMSFVAMFAMLLIQIFFWIIAPKQTVFQENFALNSLAYDSLATYSTNTTPLVSKPFTIEKTSKLAIELTSTMDNSWLESSITMVNEATKDELPIVIGNEFYRGVESGEAWTEGSQSASLDYSSVPAGKYHLLIETSTSNINAGSYTIILKSGGVYWVNIFIMLALAICLPLYLYYKENNFERTRWFDSDFPPITHNEDDE